MTKISKATGMPTRSEEDRRRHFEWADDDVLHLQIDGEEVKSTPPPPANSVPREE